MDELQSFLTQNPQLLRRSWQKQAEPEDAVVWEEVPDSQCCWCCNGTGLVCDDAMRRFIDPEYDPTMSPPIRCLRSHACGMEEAVMADKDNHQTLRRRRFEHRTEIPELPRAVADRIHHTRKQEAKALALSGDRAERVEAMKAQIRAGLTGLTRGSRPLQAPADE